MLVTLLVMFANIGHTYNTLATYNFHEMSTGDTSISCTEDSTNNNDWQFVSKSNSYSYLLEHFPMIYDWLM